MDLGAPVNLLLKRFDLGGVPLLPFLRLGLGVRELVFQLQVLKNEQLEKLATPVVRFLQKSNPGKVKKVSGTGARDSDDSCNVRVQKETRGLPESPIMVIRINKEKGLGDWRPSCTHVYQFLEIQAELLSHSKECQQLNPNLGDWGIICDKINMRW